MQGFTSKDSTQPKAFGCVVYKSADQTTTDTVDTKVTFDTVLQDDFGWFDDTNDRIYVPASGLYLATGGLGVSADSTSQYQVVTLRVNGTLDGYIHRMVHYQSISVYHSYSRLYVLDAGDYVEMWADLDGSSFILVRGGSTQTQLGLFLLGT